MLDAISQLFTRPASFFRTLKDDDRVVSRAVIVVLVVSLIAAVSAYFSALPLADATRGTALALAFNPLIATLITLGAIFLLWLIYGLLVRMGAGMESKPWAVTGYAMAPQLLVFALLIVINALFPAQLTPVSATVDFSDPTAIQTATTSLTTELQATLANRVTTVLGYLSSIWWLILIFIGVRETAGQQKAIRATVIVGILIFAFTVVPLLLR
jgi:hypothetical protein